MPHEYPLFDFQLMASPYENYDPKEPWLPIWISFFRFLGVDAENQLVTNNIHTIIQNDPEGFQMAFARLDSRDPEKSQATIHCLNTAGYNQRESRAMTCLWLMAGSLAQGDFSVWGDCLDLLLKWVDERASGHPMSFVVSGLNEAEKLVFRQTIWLDILAGAITKRQPQQIELCRNILGPNKPEIMGDCQNETVRTLAEVVALASFTEHLSRAGGNLNKFRARLALPEDLNALDDAQPKSLIHTAGALLLLEIVAHHGVVNNPGVVNAVAAVCELASRVEKPRDSAFWIFLAGCHTVDQDRWANCSGILMNEKQNDASVAVAFRVMNEVHDARVAQDYKADMWRNRMNALGAMLA